MTRSKIRLARKITIQIKDGVPTVTKYPRGAKIVILQYDPVSKEVTILQAPEDVLIETDDLDSAPRHDVADQMLP